VIQRKHESFNDDVCIVDVLYWDAKTNIHENLVFL
jgi:hypothetical protein